MNVEEEDAALEGRIAGPHDRRLQECDRWKVTGHTVADVLRKGTRVTAGLQSLGGGLSGTCQWNKSSPTGPALHEEGGSLPMSCNSFWIRFDAMMLFAPE